MGSGLRVSDCLIVILTLCLENNFLNEHKDLPCTLICHFCRVVLCVKLWCVSLQFSVKL